jgi:hypothetical protein
VNRTDVTRYEALHWSLYQAQVGLDAQSACPQGHPFTDGFDVQGGRVVGIKVNVHVTPRGRAVCRLCNAERAAEFRRRHKGETADEGSDDE